MPSYGQRLADGFEMLSGSEAGGNYEQRSDLATMLRIDDIFYRYYPAWDDEFNLGEQVFFDWYAEPSLPIGGAEVF